MGCKLSFSYANCANPSTAPTSISGITSICAGSSTTLTATGGTLATGAVYQWGTGTTIGNNIISGAAASITVSPTSSTTYWVRRVDPAPCAMNTGGVTQAVTVATQSTAPTSITGITTICLSNSTTLTASGGTLGTNGTYEWGTGYTAGVNTISGATSSTLAVSPTTTTGYWIRRVDAAPCSISTAITTTTVNVNVPAGDQTSYGSNSWIGYVYSGLNTSNPPTNAFTASLVIENNGSLVQVSNTASNIGNITFKRNTAPLKQYDYTYWASPLAGQTLNQLGSPSIFYAFNPSINNWSAAASSTIMAAAKGYISRVPNNLSFATPQVLNVTFTGVPNNGIISAPIIKGTGTFNLIGNPYPSAIDIDAFLLDSANTGVVNGTIYLWTHNTAIANVAGTGMYNYTKDDYAKYNITGGVKTASTALTGGAEPTGKIAAGQGFFIEANTSLAAGTYSATFNNSMRIANNNNQFFKVFPAETDHTPVFSAPTLQKNRVWLNISNATGAYDEALVGYITGATDGFDNLYDGKTFPAGNVVSIYSILNSNNLSIQGRSLPFHDDDIVPLGITTTISGDFSINLEHFDGLFQNQIVYLLDKSTGLYHDLKSGAYNFTITSGSYYDRFELRFANGTLGVDNPIAEENLVSIIKSDKHIEVNAGNSTIENVMVFDLLGKLLYTAKDINSNEFKTADFNIPTQIVIVKVGLDNGKIIAKKVIMNK